MATAKGLKLATCQRVVMDTFAHQLTVDQPDRGVEVGVDPPINCLCLAHSLHEHCGQLKSIPVGVKILLACQFSCACAPGLIAWRCARAGGGVGWSWRQAQAAAGTGRLPLTATQQDRQQRERQETGFLGILVAAHVAVLAAFAQVVDTVIGHVRQKRCQAE